LFGPRLQLLARPHANFEQTGAQELYGANRERSRWRGSGLEPRVDAPAQRLTGDGVYDEDIDDDLRAAVKDDYRYQRRRTARLDLAAPAGRGRLFDVDGESCDCELRLEAGRRLANGRVGVCRPNDANA
jgi:hypothetical protein